MSHSCHAGEQLRTRCQYHRNSIARRDQLIQGTQLMPQWVVTKDFVAVSDQDRALPRVARAVAPPSSSATMFLVLKHYNPEQPHPPAPANRRVSASSFEQDHCVFVFLRRIAMRAVKESRSTPIACVLPHVSCGTVSPRKLTRCALPVGLLPGHSCVKRSSRSI